MSRFYVDAFFRRMRIFLLPAGGLLMMMACAGQAKPAVEPLESRWPVKPEVSAVLDKPAENYPELRQQLRALMETTPHPDRIGASVREINSPLAVFDHNGDWRFAPVASQKLLTTAAALDFLGSDFRFLTRVVCAGNLEGKVLRGHLVVIGSGDPTLGGRFERNPRDTTAIFREWAADIREFGIEKIDGAVIGQSDYFDNTVFLPDWPREKIGESFLAEVSALSFNENAVDILFRGGRKPKKPTRHELAPQSDYYLFHNGVVTGEKGRPAALTVRRQANANLIRAKGTVPPRSETVVKASISNPPAWFATVLRETLVQSGIEVVHPTGLDQEGAKDFQTTPSWPVAFYRSPPLSEIVGAANRFSLHLYAEMLLKTLGKMQYNRGTFEGGASAVKNFLERNRLDGAADAILRDGSGISRRNAVSPRLTTSLLRHMTAHAATGAFIASLPHPGERDTLLEDVFFFERKQDSSLASRVRAVTGNRMGDCDFAGYVRTSGGMRLAFSFCVNDPDLSPEEASALLERLLLVIARSTVREE